MKRTLPLLAAGLLLASLLLAGWRAQSRPQPVALTPSLTGQVEYCLTCHSDLPLISPSHPVERFGCVRCHGGERLALDADLAHSTLRGGKNPSAPEFAEAACGGSSCHAGPAEATLDQMPRLANSLHTTYAGALRAVRQAAGLPWEAGAQTSLGTFDPAAQAQPPWPAFAQNCLGCHLASPTPEAASFPRETGCAACHAAPASAGQPRHRLTTAPAFELCNACHFQGTYNTLRVSFEKRQPGAASRLQQVYLPDQPATACEAHLDCIDCHTRFEIMGDGQIYGSEAEATQVTCRTCHGTLNEPPRTLTLTRPDELALRLAALNPAILLHVGDTILMTAQGDPLWNIHRLPNGKFELIGKASGQHYILPLVQGSACQQKSDQQAASDCHACHNLKNPAGAPTH